MNEWKSCSFHHRSCRRCRRPSNRRILFVTHLISMYCFGHLTGIQQRNFPYELKYILCSKRKCMKKKAQLDFVCQKKTPMLCISFFFFPLVTGIIIILKQKRLTREKKTVVDWTVLYLKMNIHPVLVSPTNKYLPWNHNHHLADFAFSRFRLNFRYVHERDKWTTQRVLDQSFYGNFNEVFCSFRNFISFLFRFFVWTHFTNQYIIRQIPFFPIFHKPIGNGNFSGATCCHAHIKYHINIFDRLSPTKFIHNMSDVVDLSMTNVSIDLNQFPNITSWNFSCEMNSIYIPVFSVHESRYMYHV